MQQQSLPHPFLQVLLLCAIHLYQIYTLGCKETLRVLLSSPGTLDTLTQITDSTPAPMQSHLLQPLGPPLLFLITLDFSNCASFVRFGSSSTAFFMG